MKIKNIKLYIVIVCLFVISVIGTYQLAKKIANDSKEDVSVQLMNEDEKISLKLYHLGNFGVVSRDKNGNIESFRFLGLKKAEPLKLAWMTDEEKTNIGLNTEAQAQVLQRDSQGKIVAYRIVYHDTDIITEY